MHRSRRWRLPAVTTLLLALSLAPVGASTFHVTTLADSGPGSLRQAILDAGASLGADTIDFVLPAGGTIHLQTPLPQISAPVTISGPGRDLLTIDAQQTGSVLVLSLQGDVRVSDLTLTGGLADSGGGLLIASGRLVELHRVSIRDNRALRGGGISVANPSIQLVLLDSLVSDNVADRGGGLRNNECNNQIRIERSLFSGNRAEAPGAGYGGGIDACANIHLFDSALIDNEATVRGGALQLSLALAPQILIRNTTMSGNRGGGLFIAHRGGSNPAPTVTLEHVTIAGSLQTSDPGSIQDHGLYRAGFPELSLTIRNSLIADNQRGDCNTDVAAAGSHRLDSDGSCGFDGANDLPATDPLVAIAADNGGPTPTAALPPGSPAVDAADAGTCLPTDQRGVARPQDGDGDGVARCDLGAFELESGTSLCAADAHTLCLNRDRFEVTAEWRDFSGDRGAGGAELLTSDTGYFWFFSDTNVEVVIKVLDGCSVNDRYWVFAAGLTNVEVVLRVRDTLTGAQRTYTNTLGLDFQPVLDAEAFATCP